MIYVIRYTIIAALCSVRIVPSVTAKDVTHSQDNSRIKQSDGRSSELKTIRGRVLKAMDNSLTVEQ